MNGKITINEKLNGIEVSFESKPAKMTLDALKANGFRWHNTKKIWYAKNTPERMEKVQAIMNINDYAEEIRSSEPMKKPTRKESSKPANKFGVEVGDVFYESWGYEQTNIDFWQVTALRGASQIVLAAIGSERVESVGFCSEIVKPMKDHWSSHYAGETLIKTVKGTVENPYCSSDHGNLYKTTWDAGHNATSYA